MSDNPLETPAAPPAGDPPATSDVTTPLDQASTETVEQPVANTPVGDPPKGEATTEDVLDFSQYAPEEAERERYSKLNNKFKDHASLAKSYLELETLLSKDKMVLPTENDGSEVWNQAYKAIGHPDSPDGYQIPEVFDEDTGKAVASALHDAGVGTRQATKLLNFLAEGVTQEAEAGQEAQQQSAEAAIKALEAEVGPRNSQEYGDALNKAKIVAKHLGLNDPSYWLQPNFASNLAKNYNNLIDSGFKGVVDTQLSSGISIKQQIDDITSNPDSPWYTRYRNGDRAAHAKMQELCDQLFEIENGNPDV